MDVTSDGVRWHIKSYTFANQLMDMAVNMQSSEVSAALTKNEEPHKGSE